MNKPKLAVIETSQGTWIRLNDKNVNGPNSTNIAFVYHQSTETQPGESGKARLRREEQATVAMARELAAAPEALDLLMEEFGDGVPGKDECGHDTPRNDCVARGQKRACQRCRARDLLRLVGRLPPLK